MAKDLFFRTLASALSGFGKTGIPALRARQQARAQQSQDLNLRWPMYKEIMARLGYKTPERPERPSFQEARMEAAQIVKKPSRRRAGEDEEFQIQEAQDIDIQPEELSDFGVKQLRIINEEGREDLREALGLRSRKALESFESLLLNPDSKLGDRTASELLVDMATALGSRDEAKLRSDIALLKRFVAPDDQNFAQTALNLIRYSSSPELMQRAVFSPELSKRQERRARREEKVSERLEDRTERRLGSVAERIYNQKQQQYRQGLRRYRQEILWQTPSLETLAVLRRSLGVGGGAERVPGSSGPKDDRKILVDLVESLEKTWNERADNIKKDVDPYLKPLGDTIDRYLSGMKSLVFGLANDPRWDYSEAFRVSAKNALSPFVGFGALMTDAVETIRSEEKKNAANQSTFNSAETSFGTAVKALIESTEPFAEEEPELRLPVPPSEGASGENFLRFYNDMRSVIRNRLRAFITMKTSIAPLGPLNERELISGYMDAFDNTLQALSRYAAYGNFNIYGDMKVPGRNSRQMRQYVEKYPGASYGMVLSDMLMEEARMSGVQSDIEPEETEVETRIQSPRGTVPSRRGR